MGLHLKAFGVNANTQSDTTLKLSEILSSDSIRSISIYVPCPHFIYPYTQPHSEALNMIDNVYQLLLGKRMEISSLPHLKIDDQQSIQHLITALDTYKFVGHSDNMLQLVDYRFFALPTPDWLYIYKTTPELTAIIIVCYSGDVKPVVISEIGSKIFFQGLEFVKFDCDDSDNLYFKIKTNLFKQTVPKIFL